MYYICIKSPILYKWSGSLFSCFIYDANKILLKKGFLCFKNTFKATYM